MLIFVNIFSTIHLYVNNLMSVCVTILLRLYNFITDRHWFQSTCRAQKLVNREIKKKNDIPVL